MFIIFLWTWLTSTVIIKGKKNVTNQLAASAIGDAAVWFLTHLRCLPVPPHSQLPILSLQWFCFVCFVSCGAVNNLHWLCQLIDSAGPLEDEAGTEKHIWKVCGLEVREGAPSPLDCTQNLQTSCAQAMFCQLSNTKCLWFHLPLLLCAKASKGAAVYHSEKSSRSVCNYPSADQLPTRGNPGAQGALLSHPAARAGLQLPGLVLPNSRPFPWKGVWREGVRTAVSAESSGFLGVLFVGYAGAMVWIWFACPQQNSCWNLVPGVAVLGDGAQWEVFGSGSRSLMNGLVPSSCSRVNHALAKLA